MSKEETFSELEKLFEQYGNGTFDLKEPTKQKIISLLSSNQEPLPKQEGKIFDEASFKKLEYMFRVFDAQTHAGIVDSAAAIKSEIIDFIKAYNKCWDNVDARAFFDEGLALGIMVIEDGQTFDDEFNEFIERYRRQKSLSPQPQREQKFDESFLVGESIVTLIKHKEEKIKSAEEILKETLHLLPKADLKVWLGTEAEKFLEAMETYANQFKQ